MTAKWIWYAGDFELYHSMMLHSRREEFDYAYPPMWHVSRPEFAASFSCLADIPTDMRATILTHGKGYVEMNGKRQPLNEEILFPAGRYEVTAQVCCLDSFPSLYMDSPYLKTGEHWIGHFHGGHRKAVGCEPAFTAPTDDPAVFPFAYEALEPVGTEEVDGGILYDFGAESFGPVTVHRTPAMGEVSIYYGESREEALDTAYSYLREHIPAGNDYACKARAFRYIYVKSESGALPKISASLEYLPLADIASFSCDDEKLPAIWDICARAFHLNSREFLLDGVKRDRWVWSGDAYQSYMVDRYLYNDPQIIKRTIVALLDRPPYHQHINTINDYSFYMFLGVYDYYYATGDGRFVAQVWEQLKALYDFITSRLDEETGYVIARPGDWIFIDWADIDREGPLCAEQILLYQVYRAMEALAPVAKENTPDFGLLGGQQYEAGDAKPLAGSFGEEEDFAGKADHLRERILADFWDEEQQAFIDSFTSGKRHVTRHANIFAILYDFVDDARKEAITEQVLLLDKADPITTPYFKLFELMALAKMRRLVQVQDYIDSYWGGMIDNGATSAWEAFDPSESGAQHYAMYGDRYGRSLCHAWGSGPILLLGQYCAGVRPTSVGSKTFTVAPAPGRYAHFTAVVPIGEGQVSVKYRDGRVEACATVPGGTLSWQGKEMPIPVGEWVSAE